MAGNVGESGCRYWQEIMCTTQDFERGLGTGDQMTALQPHSSGVEIQDLPCLIIKDKYIMKSQVHVSKSSSISDIQALPRKKHYCQIYQVVKHILRGRLLASFQDLENEGGDTRIARRHKIQG
nr:hypothetical protein [Tanacetum cinerariifolium]